MVCAKRDTGTSWTCSQALPVCRTSNVESAAQTAPLSLLDAMDSSVGVETNTPRPELNDPELYARLQRCVHRVCPPWMRDRADDLAQKSVVRILEGARRGAAREGYSSAYLVRIAQTVLIDEIRAHRRRAHTRVALDPESQRRNEPRAASSADPERAVHDSQINRDLRECLDRLVRDRRLAVTLNLQGHGITEIGTIFGCPSKRAENLVGRGRSDLRLCLSKKGHTP